MRVVYLIVLLSIALLSRPLAALQLKSGHAIVEPGTGLIQFGSNPRWSTARSSYLSVSIDGVVYSNNVISQSVAHPLYNGLTSYVQDTIVTVWRTPAGVDILQRVYEGSGAEAGLAVLDVQCVNRTTVPHTCRAQYLLNGRLNETTSLMVVNARTNTAVSCDERRTDAEGIPDCFFLTLYDIESFPYTPGALVMASWRRTVSTPPTRIVYGAWEGLSSTVWLSDDYYHSSLCDGAVLMQFDARLIAHDDSATVMRLAYGVPNYCVSSSDDAGVLLVTDPVIVRHDSTRTPDTLSVQAFVWGNAQREIVSPQATLTASPAVSFIDTSYGITQSDTLSLGVGLRRREMKVAMWHLFASTNAGAPSRATTSFTLRSLNRTSLSGCANIVRVIAEPTPHRDPSAPVVFSSRTSPANSGCRAHAIELLLLDTASGIGDVRLDSAINLTMLEAERVFGSDSSHVRISVLDTSIDGYGVLVCHDRLGNELRYPIAYCALHANASADRSFDAVDVYPNPARRLLHIESEESATLLVEIVDLLGNVCHRVSLRASGTVNLEGLARGTYIVRVSSTSGTVSRRIVVQ